MTSPLISDAEMNALRDVALQGMQTDVLLYPLSNVVTDDGQQTTWTYSSTVKGWLYSTPTPVITLVSGGMATVNTYRLFLPVDTAIDAGDHVIIGGRTFIVSDTTQESTWNPLLRCSLRYAE